VPSANASDGAGSWSSSSMSVGSRPPRLTPEDGGCPRGAAAGPEVGTSRRPIVTSSSVPSASRRRPLTARTLVVQSVPHCGRRLHSRLTVSGSPPGGSRNRWRREVIGSTSRRPANARAAERSALLVAGCRGDRGRDRSRRLRRAPAHSRTTAGSTARQPPPPPDPDDPAPGRRHRGPLELGFEEGDHLGPQDARRATAGSTSAAR